MGCGSSVATARDEPIRMTKQELLLHSQLARPPSPGNETAEPGAFSCYITRRALMYKAFFNLRRYDDAALANQTPQLVDGEQILSDGDCATDKEINAPQKSELIDVVMVPTVQKPNPPTDQPESFEIRCSKWLTDLRPPSSEASLDAYRPSTPKSDTASFISKNSKNSMRANGESDASVSFVHHYGRHPGVSHVEEVDISYAISEFGPEE
jgi:hypothetical protein